MSKKFPFELHVASEYLETIGQVTLQWANFEFEFDRELIILETMVKGVDAFGNRPETYLTLVFESARKNNLETLKLPSFKRRKDFCHTLLRKLYPEKDNKRRLFENILEQASSLKRERDKMVHGIWFIETNKDETLGVASLFTETTFKDYKQEISKYSLAELNHLAFKISKLNEQFIEKVATRLC